MNQSNIIRVLVADDHPVVAQGLVALLECEADITVVGQADDGCQAVELFHQHQPDVTHPVISIVTGKRPMSFYGRLIYLIS